MKTGSEGRDGVGPWEVTREDHRAFVDAAGPHLAMGAALAAVRDRLRTRVEAAHRAEVAELVEALDNFTRDIDNREHAPRWLRSYRRARALLERYRDTGKEE